MNIKNLYPRPFASALIALGTLTTASTAAILVTNSDDGTDLTMTAVGSYDLSGVAVSASPFTGVTLNAVVAPVAAGGVYGWETGPQDQYVATSVTAPLTGTGGTFSGATTASATVPFAVHGNTQALYLSAGTPITGTVDNTATFAGVTLASLGMVAGESLIYSFGLETVTINVVPEPSSSLLLGFAGLGLISRRKRK